MALVPRDDYHVLMWTFSGSIFTRGPEIARRALDRFRQIGCNGATCIGAFIKPDDYKQSIARMGIPPIDFPAPELNASPFLENDFPFYVENFCRPIYEKWEKRKPVFRQQYEAFHRDRDPKVFTHANCPNSPQVHQAVIDRIGTIVKAVAPARHLILMYDLRDEPSITSFLLASDLCFCEHCLVRMRDWLKQRYSDLASLNREWETEFSSWDAVEPMTTEEALDRRRAGRFSFAPWADHRAFMNHSFARVVDEYAAEVRRHHPGASCGLEGTQCPSVFGGYDFSELVPVVDWFEPYQFGGALDCIRSFKRRRHTPMLKTSGLGGNVNVRELSLWSALFYSGGDSGAIIWSSDRCVDTASDDLPLTDDAVAMSRVFFELRSGAPKLLQLCDEVSSPVAVHYSQPSQNADFILTVPDDWRQVAAWETEDSLAMHCRLAWWKLLEDQGLRPVYVSARQIEAGELIARGIKLLVLPRSIAVGDAEAEHIRRFVEAGGTVVADSFAGRMDEHCRQRATGVLDELFGIRRTAPGYDGSRERASLAYDAPAGVRPRWGGGPLRADCDLIELGIEPLADTRVLGCSEMSDSPLGIVRAHGAGRALLFNAAPLAYLTARTGPGMGRSVQAFFGQVAELAGVEPELQVLDAASDAPLPCWSVFPFRLGQARYFGVVPDLAVAQDVLGAITAEAVEETSRPVRLRFPLPGHVYEVRAGRYLGFGDSVADVFHTNSISLYTVLPYLAQRLELGLAGGVASARLVVDGNGAIGQHVFRFDLFDGKGQRLMDHGANVVASAGRADWELPRTGLPTGGKLVCRDVATGVSAEVKL